MSDQPTILTRRELLDEQLRLGQKQDLTQVDKDRLRELGGLIDSIPRPYRLKPYQYMGWIVCHYSEAEEQFIACREAECLRAGSKDEIEGLIRNAGLRP